MPKTYSKGQVAEMISGLSLRLVQYYTEQGVIEPEPGQEGRGYSRQYSVKSVCEFAIISELCKFGVPLSTLKMVISLIRANGSDLRADKLAMLLIDLSSEERVVFWDFKLQIGEDIKSEGGTISSKFASCLILNVHNIMEKIDF